MKNQGITNSRTKISNTRFQQVQTPGLSDDAFYLIALSFLLKKMMGLALFQQFICSEKIVSVSGE